MGSSFFFCSEFPFNDANIYLIVFLLDSLGNLFEWLKKLLDDNC